jgi:hypothetical protein
MVVIDSDALAARRSVRARLTGLEYSSLVEFVHQGVHRPEAQLAATDPDKGDVSAF